MSEGNPIVLLQEIARFVEVRRSELSQISNSRKEELSRLADYVRDSLNDSGVAQLTFIWKPAQCEHWRDKKKARNAAGESIESQKEAISIAKVIRGDRTPVELFLTGIGVFELVKEAWFDQVALGLDLA
ncbi:MAG: hypothetical protein DHS20C16_10540 [Phycisphaerae bacterium]|nr:MAG: hypothetical protein DHS20C16_10540 [Phycisphaerae bacterium]